MRAAIYARVSTERQERQQTIDSQLTALRAWASAQEHALAEVHVFRDDGYSGSRLDRPGLDGLRDAIHDAAIDVVAVFSPDRLARKSAYQVLLLEEFRRAGCEVVFLHHPISDDPNDQLLVQIQGAIAEYERAVLAERFRRGKLQKARDGHIISAKASYGYRYEPRRDVVPARLVIDEAEADMVRQLYTWVVAEGLTIRQCMKRLNAGPWVTRSGRRQWSASVVHHILSDPIYTGKAYANPGRFGSEGWHRGQRDSCSRRRAMEAGNVGQRWGERGRSLGGVQRGPGPSAGGRQALSACGSFDDRAGGDVGRAVGSTGDRALGPQAEPGGLGGTWNVARSRACAFGVERAFPGAGCGRAGTAPRGLGEGRGRSRTCGD